MVSWFCMAFVVIVAAGMALIPIETLSDVYPSIFQILVIGLAVGWLSEIWNDRKRIKRKWALMVFLGYAIWVAITDSTLEFSDAFCRWESVIMIGAVLFVALFTRSHPHESNP